MCARSAAGTAGPAAVETTGRLQAAGLQVTLDYLGEDTTGSDQAAAVAAEYVALLGKLAASGLAATPGWACPRLILAAARPHARRNAGFRRFSRASGTAAFVAHVSWFGDSAIGFMPERVPDRWGHTAL